METVYNWFRRVFPAIVVERYAWLERSHDLMRVLGQLLPNRSRSELNRFMWELTRMTEGVPGALYDDMRDVIRVSGLDPELQ